ncbi:MAG TPA: phenylalanine--tRNA ligase subunit beta [Acidimicrobiia bacterium]|nr:phenylalanine--tRNA ligase subunit beta [Acidimicrobiia bacterium]
MKVSLRWLSDYIDLPTQDPEELRTVFASLGHEVENLEIRNPDWTGVYVARVDAVERHPNADKVRVCRVNTGRESVQVVCGAWNFEQGAKVAFAVPGATLAGGLQIGHRQIRGVESAGMICSERELGLGDDHAGILVLDPDAPVGVEFAELVALPDVIFDLAITPNRPDVMSMVGAARELSAYFGVPFAMPPVEPPTVEGTTGIRVSIADPGGCHRFVARELRGTRIGPSPFWLRQRLRAAGVRPIANVVDVTNYVMLELGQPLHAFDLDRVAAEHIIVRRAHPGETLTTLDGINRHLTTDDLVVADDEKASGLAGTMGGADSEVSQSTSRVLIEAAAWDPPTVMYMSRRHGLRSEASSRFERGVDPLLPPIAAARATRLMLELGGGESPAGWVDQIAVEHHPLELTATLSEITRVLAPDVSPEEVAPLLRRLHFEVEGKDPIRVTIPTFRRDLTRAVDLAEEVARLHGYDHFRETTPTGPGGSWTVEQRRHRQLRRLLTGAGLSQAVNLSFQGVGDLDLFAYPAGHEARATIKVKNPLNDELASLRTSLLPGLLRSLRYNTARGIADAALFETGRVFFNRQWDDDPRVPAQPERLGFAIAGSFGPRDLTGQSRPADVHTATAIWRLLAHGLGLGWYELREATAPGFHPGRTAEVLVGGAAVGHVGEIHPETAAGYELEGRVAAGELELAPLIAETVPWQLDEPSLYPAAEFDLAFEVDHDLPAAELVMATATAQADLLETVRVFDEYRGTGLRAGRKSLAIRYVFRAPDHTLSTEEVTAIRSDLIAAAEEVGATLRGT